MEVYERVDRSANTPLPSAGVNRNRFNGSSAAKRPSQPSGSPGIPSSVGYDDRQVQLHRIGEHKRECCSRSALSHCVCPRCTRCSHYYFRVAEEQVIAPTFRLHPDCRRHMIV